MQTAIQKAMALIISGDRELVNILLVTARMSLSSSVIALLIGVPLGILYGSCRFRGKNALIVVNRTLMLAQMEYLEDHLPDTVAKAAEIVKEEETIRKETESKKTEILENATTQAQSMVDEATAKAKQMMEQAGYEANSLVERAHQEADAGIDAARKEASRLIQEAEKKARQLVEEENIMRRARVESEEIRENAMQEAAEYRRKTLEFIDRQLENADRKLSELIDGVRLERNEIRNQR